MLLTVIENAPAARTTDRAPKFPKITLPLDEMTDPSVEVIRPAREMLRAYGANFLLTKSNPKTDKAAKYGYLTAPLHLAPADLSGYEMCPKRSLGCTKGCLHTAGNPIYFQPKEKARIARTLFWVEQPHLFRALLSHEISLFVKRARKARLKPSVRLNATSDVVWEVKFPTLFMKHKRVTFYDYTKIDARFNRPLPSNYHLTFSRSEDNGDKVSEVLAAGGNVAVVFGGCGIAAHPKPLPESFANHPVGDGDLHDLRFLDQKNSIVGLRAKGKAIGEFGGFVVNM